MSLAGKVHSKHNWFSQLVGKYCVFDDGSEHGKLVCRRAGCEVTYGAWFICIQRIRLGVLYRLNHTELGFVATTRRYPTL
jgi:hypothetical protein